MSRNTGLVVGFVATVAILVPAGWHRPDAEIAGDGKRVRPMQQSFTVDGARVTLDVDRNLIETGGKVTAKLVAYSDKPKQVTVDLSVWHSNNYAGERVEEVPKLIDTEKLTLEAKPGGGKPVQTILRLGDHVDGRAMTDTFRIFATKKGNRPKQGQPFYDSDDENDKAKAAAVTVIGWSGNNIDMTIEPEGKPHAGEPFFVNVRVKNTTHKPVHGLWINLGTQLDMYGSIAASDDFDIERVDETVDTSDKPLKRGRVLVARFKVTPKAKTAGDPTFIATAISTNNDIGPVVAGAMNATTLKLRGAAVAAK